MSFFLYRADNKVEEEEEDEVVVVVGVGPTEHSRTESTFPVLGGPSWGTKAREATRGEEREGEGVGSGEGSCEEADGGGEEAAAVVCGTAVREGEEEADR